MSARESVRGRALHPWRWARIARQEWRYRLDMTIARRRRTRATARFLRLYHAEHLSDPRFLPELGLAPAAERDTRPPLGGYLRRR